MLTLHNAIEGGQLLGRQPDCDDLHRLSTSPRTSEAATIEPLHVVTRFGLGDSRPDHLFRHVILTHVNIVHENHSQ